MADPVCSNSPEARGAVPSSPPVQLMSSSSHVPRLNSSNGVQHKSTNGFSVERLARVASHKLKLPPLPTVTSATAVSAYPMQQHSAANNSVAQHIQQTLPHWSPASSDPVKLQGSKKMILPGVPTPPPPRSGFGDAHLRREYEATLESAAATRKFNGNDIPEYILVQWENPRHINGAMQPTVYTQEHLDAIREENGVVTEEIMSMKMAEAIAKKKDDAQKLFMKRWIAGEIDEHGNGFRKATAGVENDETDSPSTSPGIAPSTCGYTSSSSPTAGDVSYSSPLPKVDENEGAEEQTNNQTSRTLEATADRLFHQSKFMTSFTPSKSPPPYTTTPTSSLQKTKSTNPTPPKIKAKSHSRPIPRTVTSATSIIPLPGRPDYGIYDYYQLAALCNDRNLISGGGIHICRARLIQDDIHVINGLEREAKNYAKDRGRKRKTKAPDVPNAPKAGPAVYMGKRKRETEEEEEEEEEEERDCRGKKKAKVE